MRTSKKAPYKGLGADSEEKREPVSDIDTAVVDSLKVLDPKRPIREADIRQRDWHVRFSNRPFEVKHFQTIHHCSVDVAHGLALLFGIGTTALPLWDSRTRRNNLWVGLAVRVTAGPSGHTNSPHPSSREGHLSTARWSSIVLLSLLILIRSHAAATSRVQRNSVPSNPYAVHDHGQPARQGHDRLLHSATPGDLHRPGLEP